MSHLPESITLAFENIAHAMANGMLGVIAMVAPDGRIVYAIGVMTQGAGGLNGFDPIAVIPDTRKFDGLRPASEDDLIRAGHMPGRINGAH